MNSKKEAVLRAATDLFSMYGYHAVGVDSIIARSNVAKMTFYKYFPSKDFLIESVLLKRDQELREGILSSVNQRRAPLRKLKAIFDWYELWFAHPEFHGCMFIKASEEFPGQQSRARVISRQHKAWLSGLIETILRELSVVTPDKLAFHIMVILDGLTVESNMQDTTAGPKARSAWRYVEQMVRSQQLAS